MSVCNYLQSVKLLFFLVLKRLPHRVHVFEIPVSLLIVCSLVCMLRTIICVLRVLCVMLCVMLCMLRVLDTMLPMICVMLRVLLGVLCIMLRVLPMMCIMLHVLCVMLPVLRMLCIVLSIMITSMRHMTCVMDHAVRVRNMRRHGLVTDMQPSMRSMPSMPSMHIVLCSFLRQLPCTDCSCDRPQLECRAPCPGVNDALELLRTAIRFGVNSFIKMAEHDSVRCCHLARRAKVNAKYTLGSAQDKQLVL